MENLSDPAAAPRPPLTDLTPEEYLDLLHPAGSHGRPALLWFDGPVPHSHCAAATDLALAVPSLLDDRAYISMNRFRGRRGSDQTAALNALYADLDWHKTPAWQCCALEDVEAAVLRRLAMAKVPSPSVLLHSGRGLAAIWLTREMPTAALSRWQAAMGALCNLLNDFGADRASRDPARVFRLPGSINEKSGKRVRVAGGTGIRHDFDRLADLIFHACGRPTRDELNATRNKAKARSRARLASGSMPRGLPPRERFRQIREDLEKFRMSFGGRIPEGRRNTWLHLYATTLTHDPDVEDIAGEISRAAQCAVPSLPHNEVAAIIRAAERQLVKENTTDIMSDGRYHYSGARIAEMLGVSRDMADALGLSQVLPLEARRARKAEEQRARRAKQGAKSRADWLAMNNASRTKIWERYGISRSTYYARKRAGTLAQQTPE